MLIAQISDTHIALPDSKLDRHYHTAEHLERAVAHLNGLPLRPDAVVLSGDCVDTGSIAEYERLRELLAPLTMPLHLVVGNHDNRENLRQVFRSHAEFGDLSGDEFLQYSVRHDPLRLLVLDTLVPGQPGGELCDARLAWLGARLDEAPDTPTLIFLHHPPFRTGLRVMDAMGLSSIAELGAVIAAHANVERLLSGHIHRPAQVRFHGTIAQTCPSTAHQLALDLGPGQRLAVVMEPPACLLHLWEDDTGLVTHASYIADYGDPDVLFEGSG